MKKRTAVLIALSASLVVALAMVPSALGWSVTMTAQPSLTRTWDWTIEKSVSTSSVTVAPGETATVTYSVTVTPTGYTDSNWAVSGNVHMSEDPNIGIASLRVLINPDDILASQTCVPNPFPVELGVQGLDCDYSASLPDASGPRDAWMRAVSTEGNFRNVHTAFDFSTATINEVDECVDVTDSLAGALGTVCAADGAHTFTYQGTIGPYRECGPRTVDNTATFVTKDTGATDSSSETVNVDVPCGGCTLTIGYWKTHAGFGPQADAVTPLLPQRLGTAGGTKTVNVSTAALAVQFLSMNGTNNVHDASNGINKLYAQLLGAKLNGANGADLSAVASIIAAADAFLANNNTLSWSSLTTSQKAAVNGWASALDSYNNGALGSVHCTD